MNIKTKLIEKDVWNKLVETSTDATIFHNYNWLEITANNSKMKFSPLCIMDDDTPIAIFPLFYGKKYGIKIVLSPPSKTGIPYLGYLLLEKNLAQYEKESVNGIVANEIINYIKSLKSKYVLLKMHPNITDVREFKWNHMLCTPNYTYFIDLSAPLDVTHKNFKKSLRNDITRTEKNNMTFREGNEAETLTIFESYIKRYEEQGIKYFSIKIFKELYEKFNKNIKCFVVEKDGKILNGIILICYNKIASHWMGAVKTETTSVTDFTIWNAISWAHKNNYEKFELMGANTKSLCKFKSKYNPELKTYFQITNKGLIASMVNKKS